MDKNSNKDFLKYAAWHKTKKRWIESFIISPYGKIYETSEVGDEIPFDEYYKTYDGYLDDLNVKEITDEVEMCFFTDYLDKDGNKIYSGQIIEYFINQYVTPMEAQEIKEIPMIKIIEVVKIPDCYRKESISVFPFSFKDSKIIGNIFENPELLEKVI